MKEKLILLTISLISITFVTHAKTNWRFYAGGMYAKGFNKPDSNNPIIEFDKAKDVPTKSSYTFWAGMDIQFSLKEKFFIETGVNFRKNPFLYGEKTSETDPYSGEVFKSYEVHIDNAGDRDILTIPVRFGYKLPLKGKNQLEFAIGPYVGADFDADYYVGLSPVITYKHRALSLSFHWENPVFYDSSQNHFKNQFAFTIGVNFNGRKPNMDNILIGLEVANTVLGAANQALQTYSSEYDDGSYSESFSSSNNSSSTNNYQIMYDKWERRAQEAYDSLAGHSGSASTYTRNKSLLREAQREMRNWRNKARKAGVNIRKSEWETKTVNIR